MPDVVAQLNINNIIRGVLQSASIGYFVDQFHLGRGLATRMVEHAVRRAGELGLHRLEAATIVDNLPSQGVLLRSGFVQYGTAERFLFIAGRWQDHHLYQRILNDDPAGERCPDPAEVSSRDVGQPALPWTSSPWEVSAQQHPLMDRPELAAAPCQAQVAEDGALTRLTFHQGMSVNPHFPGRVRPGKCRLSNVP